jgi:hypothetical protein
VLGRVISRTILQRYAHAGRYFIKRMTYCIRNNNHLASMPIANNYSEHLKVEALKTIYKHFVDFHRKVRL